MLRLNSFLSLLLRFYVAAGMFSCIMVARDPRHLFASREFAVNTFIRIRRPANKL